MNVFSRLLRIVVPCLVTGVGVGLIPGELMGGAPTGILLSSSTVMENTVVDSVVGTLTAVDSNPGDSHVFSLVWQDGTDDFEEFWIFENHLLVNHKISRDFEANAPPYRFRLMVTDSTGLSYERDVMIQLTDDREEDFDRDRLTEAQEEDLYGTSDLAFDSDGDGVGDGVEVADGTSPMDPNSWNQTSILGWGNSTDGEQAVPAGGEYFSLATGQAHSLALTVGGAVAAWGGLDWFDQVSVPEGLGEVIAVAAGGDYWFEDSAHSLALKSDGTVVGWGYDHEGLLVVPPGLDHVVGIAAGRAHGVALKDTGSVVVWGENPFGALEPPSPLSRVIAVAAGGFRTLALKDDGTVVEWGSNFNGGEWEDASVPSGLRDVVAISCGRFHNLALKSDGSVVAWGYNSGGQTNVPPDLRDVVAVAAGGFHSLALKSDGSVVAWGATSHGQTTVPVSAQSGVTVISAGMLHSLAVHPSLEDPSITSSPRILAAPGGVVTHQVEVLNAGTQTLAFSAMGLPAELAIDPVSGLISGTVTAAGRRSFVIRVKTERGFLIQSAWIGIAEGSPPTLVTLSSTSVTENSLAGTVVGTLSATDPDLGDSHTFELVDGPGFVDNGWFRIEGDQLIVDQAITRDYEVNPAGFSIRLSARDASLNPWEQTLSLQFLDDRTEDVDGDGLTEQQEEDVYLTSDTNKDSDYDGFGDGVEVRYGTPPTSDSGFPTGRMVVGWGRRDSGRIDPPPGLEDVVGISAGGDHSLALKSDGTVLAWGENGDSQASPPEGYQNVVEVEAGALHSMVLKRDGTVSAWGNNTSGQTDIPEGLSGVIAVSAGAYHNLALKSDGTVSAWGYNDYGQVDVPPGLSEVVAVAAGGYHSLALKSDGTIVVWGSDWGGAIASPVYLDEVISIAAGAYHSLALRADGTVVAWGSNQNGQVEVPEGLIGVREVSAGWEHSVVLMEDGSLLAWGNNEEQKTEIPQEGFQIRKIDAGSFHNLAIRQATGFPEFADVSPVHSWPGETVSRAAVIENAVVNPSPVGAGFSAMGLPAGLTINATSGLVSGLVNVGERRAVRVMADTDQGILSQVIWFDTSIGVAPNGITLSSNVVAENSPVGTVVGTLSAVDPNVGDSYTLRLASLFENDDNYWFIISGNRLIVRHRLGLDFETGGSQFPLRVEAVDSRNNVFGQDVILQMTDDRREDGDGDGIDQTVEEELLGTSDSHFDDFNTADGDHDGVSGMIEHAFNLNPKVPGLPIRLVPGENSTAGLPTVDLSDDGEGNYRLRMEYLQRVGDRLKYIPQFGSGLSSNDWVDVSEVVVTPASPGDTEWERCVVEDSFSTVEAPRRFGRVVVKYIPPDRTVDFDQDGVTLALEEDVFGTSDGVANDFTKEDQDHDGIPGMIEYAFNLEPMLAQPPVHLVPFAGSVEGLPVISLVDNDDGRYRLRIEYLRRVNSGLTYAPQFASGLGNSAWEAPVNEVYVTTIEAGKWERCVVEDTELTTNTARRFARVAVSW